MVEVKSTLVSHTSGSLNLSFPSLFSTFLVACPNSTVRTRWANVRLHNVSPTFFIADDICTTINVFESPPLQKQKRLRCAGQYMKRISMALTQWILKQKCQLGVPIGDVRLLVFQGMYHVPKGGERPVNILSLFHSEAFWSTFPDSLTSRQVDQV